MAAESKLLNMSTNRRVELYLANGLENGITYPIMPSLQTPTPLSWLEPIDVSEV